MSGTPDYGNDCVKQLWQFAPVVVGGAAEYVVELRALQVPGWKPDVKPTDDCGFFDLACHEGMRALSAALRGYVTRAPELQPEGVYVTMNPVDRTFLARANNTMGKRGQKISAGDEHVLRRDWLLVDIDPVRRTSTGAPLSKISTTDAEKAAAKHVLDGVRADLESRRFAPPMVVDSGNGYHAWYRIGLPTDDGRSVEHVLKWLARRHDAPGATVDTSCFNPSRIVKIPGTWARKGSSTADRPHRMCHILELPGGDSCVA